MEDPFKALGHQDQSFQESVQHGPYPPLNYDETSLPAVERWLDEQFSLTYDDYKQLYQLSQHCNAVTDAIIRNSIDPDVARTRYRDIDQAQNDILGKPNEL